MARDNETAKRAATSYSLAPSSAHAVATRSRKPYEYTLMPEGTAKSHKLGLFFYSLVDEQGPWSVWTVKRYLFGRSDTN